MAKMRLSNPIYEDDGHPIPRCVDGVDVEKCASYEGAFRHFGKIRKMHTEWMNSKTGKAMEAPEYARDDDGNGNSPY
jgi:hypothetical protein